MTARSIIPFTRRPDITFSANGKIDITSRVVRALGIRPGDVIGIMTLPGEYYLHIARRKEDLIGRHEAQCHPTRKNSNFFRAWSRRLTSAILSQYGSGASRAEIMVGQIIEIDGQKALTLITRNLPKK